MIHRLLGIALLAAMLSACTGYRPAPGYSVCATQPGTWECQVEQYEKVDF
jgi:hypothetical protein